MLNIIFQAFLHRNAFLFLLFFEISPTYLFFLSGVVVPQRKAKVNGKNYCFNHILKEQSYLIKSMAVFLFPIIPNLAKLSKAIFFSLSLTSERLYSKANRYVLCSVVLSPLVERQNKK